MRAWDREWIQGTGGRAGDQRAFSRHPADHDGEMRIDHLTQPTVCCILSLLAKMISSTIKELCCPRTNLNNDRTTEARVTQVRGLPHQMSVAR